MGAIAIVQPLLRGGGGGAGALAPSCGEKGPLTALQPGESHLASGADPPRRECRGQGSPVPVGHASVNRAQKRAVQSGTTLPGSEHTVSLACECPCGHRLGIRAGPAPRSAPSSSDEGLCGAHAPLDVRHTYEGWPHQARTPSHTPLSDARQGGCKGSLSQVFTEGNLTGHSVRQGCCDE